MLTGMLYPVISETDRILKRLSFIRSGCIVTESSQALRACERYIRLKENNALKL